jgi:hypothetical protein
MADVAWRFVPKEPSDHYYGVPPRDLTADEFAALTEEQQALVAAGVLYEPAVARAPRVSSRRSPVAEGEVS